VAEAVDDNAVLGRVTTSVIVDITVLRTVVVTSESPSVEDLVDSDGSVKAPPSVVSELVEVELVVDVKGELGVSDPVPGLWALDDDTVELGDSSVDERSPVVAEGGIVLSEGRLSVADEVVRPEDREAVVVVVFKMLPVPDVIEDPIPVDELADVKDSEVVIVDVGVDLPFT
jgi:hypothetical protein